MTGIVSERYEMGRALGKGGAASVFLATDLVQKCPVALKFFPPIGSSTPEFQREAAATLSLRHPGLIHLLDAGVHDGAPYLVLEYVEGEDLRTRIQAGPIPPAEALSWMIQLFDALGALHRAGLVHGDIKPENVILGADRLRLVDFGRARLGFRADGQGMFPGTAPYMHPDLFVGGSPSPETDVFAAWVTTYELFGGQRPFTESTLRWSPTGQIPPFTPLLNAEYDKLVRPGIVGEYRTARRSWVALSCFAMGRREALRVLPAAQSADPARLRELRRRTLMRESIAVVGDPDDGRALLESTYRLWNGSPLWASAGWGNEAVPFSAAIALVSRLGDVLGAAALAVVRRELGPLGSVLASLSPAARTWLGDFAASEVVPTPSQVFTTLRRAITALPGPVLVCIDGLDRLDGSSRRFFSFLAVGGDVVVCGSAFPGGVHGLPGELRIDPAPARTITEDGRPAAPSELVSAARALSLPFGPLLAQATSQDLPSVMRAALHAEAEGYARFDGVEVVATPGSVRLAITREWARKACHNLDAREWPLYVARYATLAGERGRLAETVDLAVERLISTDPAEALRLAMDDPRPPTGARLLRALRAAVLARDMAAAAAIVEKLSAHADVSDADRAEAEGEYLFRLGRNLEAIAAFRRAAADLGQPLTGWWHLSWGTLMALVRITTGFSASPKPDLRLARIFERLHDLHLATDHGPMLAIHHRWLAAGPDHPRAQVMDVIWKTAMGLHGPARRVEARLLATVPEHKDAVGAAVVVMHRAIVDLWRGETLTAFAGANDACDRLARAGDLYLAALASTTMAAAGIHLASPGPMIRVGAELGRLAEIVGDVRSYGWLLGLRLAVALSLRRDGEAEEIATEWIADAADRHDSGEAVARRLRAEIRLSRGAIVEAVVDLAAAKEVVKRNHLRLDLTDALAIPQTMAAAQSRLFGAATSTRLSPDLGGMNRLIRRSPRWESRVFAARGAWAAAVGNRAEATKHFDGAVAAAHARRQTYDAWSALTLRARVLNDDGAMAEAELLARTHGMGETPRGLGR